MHDKPPRTETGDEMAKHDLVLGETTPDQRPRLAVIQGGLGMAAAEREVAVHDSLEKVSICRQVFDIPEDEVDSLWDSGWYAAMTIENKYSRDDPSSPAWQTHFSRYAKTVLGRRFGGAFEDLEGHVSLFLRLEDASPASTNLIERFCDLLETEYSTTPKDILLKHRSSNEMLQSILEDRAAKSELVNQCSISLESTTDMSMTLERSGLRLISDGVVSE